ncbi:cupredoxin family copper-binding protein [Achromobacter denitrificans]|uniref:cupredoxin domain-containing protein n=1 Tax=Achromobacter denitrificans TaxID=32002 RepID=UPI0023E85DD5|nr:cupredoxin family copper-binding protein [Achromobacter denitrificans]MDF3857495.1 cupredoxin family copper-binding protein [Achromobacter denitrificans]
MARPAWLAAWRRAGAATLCAGLILAGAPARAADDPPGARAASHTVTIEGMQFTPAALSVRRGDKVTWVNKDLVPHTATALSRAFDSGAIAGGASWTYTVGEAGTIAYTCLFHPTMQGTLVAQ